MSDILTQIRALPRHPLGADLADLLGFALTPDEALNLPADVLDGMRLEAHRAARDVIDEMRECTP